MKGNPIDILVGRNINRIRRKRGLSLSALAKAYRISHQQLSKYEKGENRISAGRLYDLAAILDCKVEDFYRGATMRHVSYAITALAAHYAREVPKDGK